MTAQTKVGLRSWGKWTGSRRRELLAKTDFGGAKIRLRERLVKRSSPPDFANSRKQNILQSNHRNRRCRVISSRRREDCVLFGRDTHCQRRSRRTGTRAGTGNLISGC